MVVQEVRINKKTLLRKILVCFCHLRNLNVHFASNKMSNDTTRDPHKKCTLTPITLTIFTTFFLMEYRVELTSVFYISTYCRIYFDSVFVIPSLNFSI